MDARVLRAGDPTRTLIAYAEAGSTSSADALRARGVGLLEAPGVGGRVDLGVVLAALARREVVSVLAEGGAELGGALVEAGFVDRVAFFVAPRLLGGRGAPGPLGGPGRTLKDAVSLTGLSCRPVGEDLLIEGDVAA